MNIYSNKSNRLDYMRDLLAIIMQLKAVEPSNPLIGKAEKILSEILDGMETTKHYTSDAI